MNGAGHGRRSAGVFTLANGITLLRYPLLVLVIWLLYQGAGTGRLAALVLVGLLMLLDTVDGVVARWRQETSLLGSTLDIATDRMVEIVLWVVFAHLGLIPIVVPLVVMIRGALVDSIRDGAAQEGITAHQMMRGTVGRWLVASAFMRTGYSVVKIFAFLALTLTLVLQARGAAFAAVQETAVLASWLAVGFCLLRGIPVVVEAPGFFREREGRQGVRGER